MEKVKKTKRYCTPAGLANLRPGNTRTYEENRALGLKGAEKAKENREHKKTFKAALEWALDLPAMPTENEEIERIRTQYPDITNREAMAIAMARETLKEGNVRAFVAVRDTTGELPAQTVNVQGNEPMTINIKTID